MKGMVPGELMHTTNRYGLFNAVTGMRCADLRSGDRALIIATRFKSSIPSFALCLVSPDARFGLIHNNDLHPVER